MRWLFTHSITAYLAVGISHGVLLSMSIPAMNWFGVAAYATTWPRFMYCAPVARDCDPLSSWPMWLQSMMFTF